MSGEFIPVKHVTDNRHYIEMSCICISTVNKFGTGILSTF